MGKDILNLTVDQKEYLTKTLKDLIFISATMRDFIEKDQLTEEFSGTLMSLIESHSFSIFESMNFNKKLVEEKEKRHLELKNAYTKIRELEGQIQNLTVSSFDNSLLSHAINSINEKLKDRWDNKETGLDGLVKTKIEGHIASIEFIPMFMCHTTFSNDPATKRREFDEYIESLKERGFIFAENKDELIFNEKNIQLCMEIIKKILPSFKLKEIANNNWDNNFRLSSLKGSIGVKELLDELE